MLVGLPLHTDFGIREEQDWESASISTVGAVIEKDNHGALTKASFETHLGKEYGYWSKQLTGNKIPNDDNLEKNTPGLWSDAWNNTIRMLNPKIINLIQLSKKWPDEGFGGKRCVKQLFEILVLHSYVKNVCDNIRNTLHERHNVQKNKLSNTYASLSIDPSNEEIRIVDALSYDIQQLSSNYKRLTQNVGEITQCIINDFFTNTIKSNTIKQERHQIYVQTFVDNPTVEEFETLCDHFAVTNWRSFVHDQYLGWSDYCETRGINCEDLSEDFDEPPAKRKRINHSDQEKLRIKQKTECKCVGLPHGLRTCPYFGITRSPVLLKHEHRVPVSLEGQTALQMSLEEDKNRWGMCPECDTIKTHYIDPHIRKHKNDLQFMQNYLLNYTLPQELIEQINLKIRMDEPETIKPIPSNYQHLETTGNTLIST